MLFLTLAFGKLTSFFIQSVLNRNASTWPGHIVLESNPNFIKKILRKNKELKIILIAGTNGKTTTTKALYHILKSNNISVIRNDSGANLLNGFASLVIKNSNLFGKIDSTTLLFEVDENSLPLILKDIRNPQAIILLNLFRDQLDRYGEINTTSEKWEEALLMINAKTTIIANSDDPQIAHIVDKTQAEKIYYSIEDNLKTEKALSHAVDSTNCPICRNKLHYSRIAYSHIGNFSCPKCKFANPKSKKVNVKTDLMGTFNTYNLTAAILCTEKLFKVQQTDAIEDLKNFKAAFGRQENISYKDRKLLLLLSKNPTGFNESLKVIIKNKYTNLLLILNDRIPDGRDISWIWDVDFELLAEKKLKITIAGDRVYDLANRLHYAGIKNLKTYDDLEQAVNACVLSASGKEKIAILPTYSAMLEVRKIITGKSIL